MNKTGIAVIADTAACRQLAAAESARILVLSDIHTMIPSVADVIINHRSSCSAAVFCGDCGDALSSLSADYPNLFNPLFPVVAVVRGNSDNPVITLPRQTFLLPPYVILTAAEKRIYITHGHTMGVNYSFEQLAAACTQNDCKIALFGHIHVPLNEVINGVRLINPGSAVFPRGGSKQSYAIIEAVKTKEDIAVQFFTI